MNKDKMINAGCACVEKNGIWFVHYALPLLMFYEFKEKAVTKFIIIPCGNIFAPVGIYSGIEYINQKLFLLSGNVQYSLVYEVETGEFRKIQFEKNDNKMLFSGSYLVNDSIYAVPLNKEYIVKIDGVSEKIEYLKTNKSFSNLNGINCIENRIVCGNSSNGLLEYNIEDNTVNQIVVQNENTELGYVDSDGENYYGYDMLAKRVVKFDKAGKIEKISRVFDIKSAFIKHTKDGYIIVDDNYSGKIFILDEELSVVTKLEDIIIADKNTSPYLLGCWGKLDNKIFGITKSSKLLIVENGEINQISLSISEDLFSELSEEYIKSVLKKENNILEEGGLNNLKSFIKVL